MYNPYTFYILSFLKLCVTNKVYGDLEGHDGEDDVERHRDAAAACAFTRPIQRKTLACNDAN